MSKKYYHATATKNVESIIEDGAIYTGIDGIVYLAESAEEALRFCVIRLMGEPITVFEISGLDESKVFETFDHNPNFFKCKAFGYPEDITLDKVSNVLNYSK